jgi:hypothetical protein
LASKSLTSYPLNSLQMIQNLHSRYEYFEYVV